MYENSHIDEEIIKTHKELNNNLLLEEELEYWQDKVRKDKITQVLELKLQKEKNDYEYMSKTNKIESDYEKLKSNNNSLSAQIEDIISIMSNLRKEVDENEGKLEKIKDEIQFYEKKNNDLWTEVKITYNVYLVPRKEGYNRKLR